MTTSATTPGAMSRPRHWFLVGIGRLGIDTVFKSFGVTGFLTAFFVLYFDAMARPQGRFFEMPLTWVDRVVPFTPWALLLYVSLWVYVSLPPGLFVRRAELVRFGVAAAAMCGIGLACFYLWPTAVPTPDIEWARYPGFAWLKGIDVGGNACPSLHVAGAVFTCFWLHWQLCGLGASRMGRALNVLWCVAIVFSTIATRQHVALDVLAGFALGAATALLSRPWVLGRRASS